MKYLSYLKYYTFHTALIILFLFLGTPLLAAETSKPDIEKRLDEQRRMREMDKDLFIIDNSAPQSLTAGTVSTVHSKENNQKIAFEFTVFEKEMLKEAVEDSETNLNKQIALARLEKEFESGNSRLYFKKKRDTHDSFLSEGRIVLALNSSGGGTDPFITRRVDYCALSQDHSISISYSIDIGIVLYERFYYRQRETYEKNKEDENTTKSLPSLYIHAGKLIPGNAGINPLTSKQKLQLITGYELTTLSLHSILFLHKNPEKNREGHSCVFENSNPKYNSQNNLLINHTTPEVFS